MADTLLGWTMWFGRRFSTFFTWWRDELAGMLPGALRDLLRRGGRRLLLVIERDSVVLTAVDGAGPETLGRFPLAPDDSGSLRGLGQGREVVLCLPEEVALVKQMTLPDATEENLRRVLGYMMDRNTPFSADDVYYDFRILARDRTRRSIDVELSLTPRASVDSSLGALRALGLEPDRVTVGCDPEGELPPLNLLPPEGRRRRGKAQPAANYLLAAIAGALLIAVLVQPQWEKWQAIGRLEADAAAAGRAAAEAEQLRERTALLEESSSFLAEKKRSMPLVLEVLTEVTSILPDDTWLSNVSINGREIQLRGFSSASAALIPVVESSPLFRNANFRSPVLRDSLSESERFDLSAEISPQGSP